MAWIKFLLAAAIVGYLLVLVLVWLGQDRLLFYPRASHGSAAAPQGWQLEAVRIVAHDATPLVGVLVKPPRERAPLVIYFGGNAEEVTEYAADAQKSYGDRAALYVNYRGYGESGGKPSEKDLVADGAELFDWAARRSDVDATRIALHGRSLGSGVAVQVAALRPARCVILTSPFDSAREVARAIYPWLPVGMLMRHPFDSAALAPRIPAPARFHMGDADTLIPKSHSERLASLWAGPAERVSFEGFGHNDLGMSPRYDAAVQVFLDRHL